ncbi:P-II family nitrogen regulator [Desulfosarcina alkanivorans]|uniref:P-II family nitrogen regulator n=1 Tax=Desulfosarcina alkanivorans TaxID=571177 RepID=A0A5K7YVI0_9BACT|nr:P-II family nitrogen regulator [Desulfosarcina alkanivorans]BBO71061.1 P-II family nitrogen regulator [Desulfosarcina alkanivorans]
MKELIAIVRMNMMNRTKLALAEAGLGSITAREALGRGKGIIDMQLLHGAEHGYEEAIAQLGQSHRLIPKRALLMVVNDDLVQKAVKTIIRTNQTGKSGDGMIFVFPCQEAVRVRTGERGEDTLDEG